jgi:radical SAM protein with 4Fe4S-binding SPASM domain
VDEVKDWPHEEILFNLTGLSEPTLFPRLVESVKYIKNRVSHSRVKIITNGIALTNILSKDLLQAGLDEITISVNGSNREDYLAICGVDLFEEVTENIRALIENRRDDKTSALCINLNFKKHEANASLIQNAVSYWKLFLDDKDVISISNILPLRGDSPIETCIDAPRRYPCVHLWGEIKLDIQGNIYPCDGKVMDYHYREESELFLGNIRKMSLKEAYLSDKVRHIRKCHLEGKFFMTPTCQSCPSWSRFNNHWISNNYFPFLKKKWL